MKLYIVMHNCGSGVAFFDKAEAGYAHDGEPYQDFGVNTVADNFREAVLGSDHRETMEKIPMFEIELTPKQSLELADKLRAPLKKQAKKRSKK